MIEKTQAIFCWIDSNRGRFSGHNVEVTRAKIIEPFDLHPGGMSAGFVMGQRALDVYFWERGDFEVHLADFEEKRVFTCYWWVTDAETPIKLLASCIEHMFGVPSWEGNAENAEINFDPAKCPTRFVRADDGG